MGACEFVTSYGFRPGPVGFKSWEQHKTSHTGPKATAGQTTYCHYRDVDRQSQTSDSSDDNYSVADSTSDVESIASSQTSISSEDSDDAQDNSARNESYGHIPREHSSRATNKSAADQAEILRGLETRPFLNQEQACAAPSILRHGLHTPLDDGGQTAVRQGQTSRNQYPDPSRCNRRRSGSHDVKSQPPCRLRRDTESADCFVMLLITFATRLITAIWPLSACPPKMSTSFNGAGVLPLEVFIHETLRRSKTSYSTLQVALYYIILLKDKLSNCDFTKEQPGEQAASGCRAMQCGRRMFLAALMLASKYIQDRNYSTRAWSKISGLRIPEINENEAQYLRCIDYRLHMRKESFENWSKIVLTLSKLSRLSPGCSKANDSPNLPPNDGDYDMLSEMVSQTEQANNTQHSEIYSDHWWSWILKSLEPGLVEDANTAEGFLRDHLPPSLLAEILSKADAGPPSPPSSPESCSEGAYNDTMPLGNMQGRAATPVQNASASPAKPNVLPLRPQPRNLPTPQSTPRASDACSWSTLRSGHQTNLRCSASIEALRSVRKQCLLNANLERCPPPRPQSFNLPPTRTTMRPAESSQLCHSRSVTPSTSSPALSTVSRSGRSRSSSISSVATWTSFCDRPPSSLESNQETMSTASPLTRVVSLPKWPTQETPSAQPQLATPPRQALRRRPHFSSMDLSEAKASQSQATPRFQDLQRNSADETDAITALVAMSASRQVPFRPLPEEMRVQSAPPTTDDVSPPRGHKRAISSSCEPLQQNVRRLLQGQDGNDVVTEDGAQSIGAGKQWQAPSKPWAMSKRPLPNPFDNKRMAFDGYCAMQQQQSAASVAAARYLKDQLAMA